MFIYYVFIIKLIQSMHFIISWWLFAHIHSYQFIHLCCILTDSFSYAQTFQFIPFIFHSSPFSLHFPFVNDQESLSIYFVFLIQKIIKNLIYSIHFPICYHNESLSIYFILPHKKIKNKNLKNLIHSFLCMLTPFPIDISLDTHLYSFIPLVC